MKKLFLFLLISLFLISFVSAWDYSREATHPLDSNIVAYAKVVGMYPACDGEKDGKYCAGRWYVDVSHEGDKFYIAYRASAYPTLTADGYSGQGVQPISDGRIYLNENGQVPRYILCAWDYDKGTNYWIVVGKCAGYIGEGYLDRYHVECSEDVHCSSGEVCDMAGEWSDWNCITDPCKYTTCDDYCQNSIRYSEGYCSDGDCKYTENTCTHGCSGELCAEDPCKGVLCEDKCENGIWFHDGNCVNGNCVYDTKDTCQYGCKTASFLSMVTTGMCRANPCEGTTCEDYCSGTTSFYDGKCIDGVCTNFKEKPYAEECGAEAWYKNVWIWIGVGIFIIIIVFGIWWWRRRK